MQLKSVGKRNAYLFKKEFTSYMTSMKTIHNYASYLVSLHVSVDKPALNYLGLEIKV